MTEQDQGAPGPLQKEKIIADTQAHCLEWSRPPFEDFLQTLQDKLLQMAEKAGSDTEENRYFQARNEFQGREAELRDQFLGQIRTAFDRYQQGMHTCTDFGLDPMQQGTADRELREEDLSLVDNRELEDRLAVASMSRRRSADNTEALYALNRRLSAMHAGLKIGDHTNPFAPGVFAESLQSTIAGLTLDETSRLTVFKVFDNTFMAQLKTLYQQLNHQLQQQGLLPNLSYQVNKTPEEIHADLPEELKGQFSEISVQRQLDLIKAIQVLQKSLQPRPEATERPPHPGGSALSAQQLLASMQQFQHDARVLLNGLETPQAVAANSTDVLRQRVEEQIHRTRDVDRNVIEIVGLLFEYMLNDRQLPDSVKTLLSYLHTPFLKIALIDKDFFNHPEHPARQLLNSLVAAGERWVEPGAKRKSEVFEQIRKVVERVLRDFDNDIRLFSELAFEFNQFLRQHARRVRLSEKRAMQAAQGENKLRAVRLKVEQYLTRKIGSTTLPPPIRTLLFEPWANFLAFNLLRFGSRSEQWRSAAQVVDDIIWYSQPHDIQADIHARKRIEELQRSLPATLQAGFETVGYDTAQGQRLIRSLQHHQPPAAPAGQDNTPARPEVTDIEQIDIAADSPSPAPERMSLEPGTWFELTTDDQPPQQVKLAWASHETLQFMFVNRLGQQVAVQSGAELDAAIRDGRLRQLPDPGEKPFFEKAMESVLDKLQQR